MVVSPATASIWLIVARCGPPASAPSPPPGRHARPRRRRLADGRVAGHGFYLAHRRAMRPARQRLLDTAMLIAERNFQMQHLFAVALKTKMARLDDARVNRPDGDFVN